MRLTKLVPSRLRHYLGDVLFYKLFSVWEALGFHVIPNNHMSPIPDLRVLPADLWKNRSELVGLDMNEQGQLHLLQTIRSQWKSEYDALPWSPQAAPHRYYLDNPKFGPVDAEMLYGMIRSLRPRMIFEVGSGYSTYLSAQAALRNQRDGIDTQLAACEPYPNDILRRGFPGLSRLLPCRLEQVERSEFLKLGENDILFIDSSHVLRIGGDVQYLFLEVLPRLNPGVVIHVHDIFFPFEYPAEWPLRNHRFYSEQYVLQAFLAFNRCFGLLWVGSYMDWKYPDALRGAFDSYGKTGARPSSVWMKRLAW